MRLPIAAALSVALFSVAHAAPPSDIDGYAIAFDEDKHRILEIVGPVRELEGSPSVLTTRAQACIARIFTTSTTTQGTVLEAFGGNFAQNKKEALPVIELADKDAGQIVANSVAPYSAALLSYVIKARVTFQAKENRFRFVHTDLATAASNGQGDYTPLVAAWGTGWEKAARAMITKTTAAADCIVTPANDNW